MSVVHSVLDEVILFHINIRKIHPFKGSMNLKAKEWDNSELSLLNPNYNNKNTTANKPICREQFT